MIETYIININRYLSAQEFNELTKYITQEKKERLARFHRFEDAQRSLVGDLLSRYAICKRACIKNESLHFGINAYGKPILLNTHNIHFNIAHSENWVVCTIDDDAIGIDVEEVKPIDLDIAAHFFSRNECLTLMNQPETSRMKYFYRIWTLKESYIKAKGMGLSIPLDSFSVVNEENTMTNYFKGKIQEYICIQSELEDGSMLAICALNNQFSEWIEFNIENFLSSIAIVL
jgi:4'-phosphopantetheinyl transferase